MGSEPSALIGRITGDGPLFRSRYKAILIDAEKYFLSVGRYLHQNSIRAALVTNMGQPLNLKVAEDAAQAVAEREEEFIYYGQSDFHLGGLLTVEGRNNLKVGNWSNVDEVLNDVLAAVNVLDSKGYRGPYGLALAPELYNNLFRRYAGSDLLQIEHLKRLCTRGIVKAAIDGCVLVARDVGSIVLGQDMQVAYLASDAGHENFAVSESLVLKIEAPDAICTIGVEANDSAKARKRSAKPQS